MQGRFLRIVDSPCPTDYWSRAAWSLSAQQMINAVNSAQDTLPHNSNLVRLKRPMSTSLWSSLCGGLQTLRHILNGCKQALHERLYNQRHYMHVCIVSLYIRAHEHTMQSECYSHAEGIPWCTVFSCVCVM